MTRFRPCIDLHAGQVKQIVGGTLDSTSGALQTNYVSQHPAAHYARLYRDASLEGAHVIMLGPGNDESARQALQAWPGHLQVGGGINDGNARQWMDAGASKVRGTESVGSSWLTAASRSSSPRSSSRRAASVSPGSMPYSRPSAATRASSSSTLAVGGVAATRAAGSWP